MELGKLKSRDKMIESFFPFSFSLYLLLQTATKWMYVNVKNCTLLMNRSLDQICVCHCALEDNKQMDEALYPIIVFFCFFFLNTRCNLSDYQVPFISSLMVLLFHGTPLP